MSLAINKRKWVWFLGLYLAGLGIFGGLSCLSHWIAIIL